MIFSLVWFNFLSKMLWGILLVSEVFKIKDLYSFLRIQARKVNYSPKIYKTVVFVKVYEKDSTMGRYTYAFTLRRTKALICLTIEFLSYFSYQTPIVLQRLRKQPFFGLPQKKNRIKGN